MNLPTPRTSRTGQSSAGRRGSRAFRSRARIRLASSPLCSAASRARVFAARSVVGSSANGSTSCAPIEALGFLALHERPIAPSSLRNSRQGCSTVGQNRSSKASLSNDRSDGRRADVEPTTESLVASYFAGVAPPGRAGRKSDRDHGVARGVLAESASACHGPISRRIPSAGLTVGGHGPRIASGALRAADQHLHTASRHLIHMQSLWAFPVAAVPPDA